LIKKLLLFSLLSLLLGACATENDPKEQTVPVEEVEILTPEMTTTFKPKITALRELSEEDYQIYEELLEVVAENTDDDREAIYKIAPKYDKEPEELWKFWLESKNTVKYGDMGETAIVDADFLRLIEQVVEQNISGQEINVGAPRTEWDEEEQISISNVQVEVDGKQHHFRVKLSYSEDYRTAELMSLRVDGKSVAF
jgi:hypothetical protein